LNLKREDHANCRQHDDRQDAVTLKMEKQKFEIVQTFGKRISE
jgi:hypothetical protein